MYLHLKILISIWIVTFSISSWASGGGEAAKEGAKPAEMKSPEWMELNNVIISLRSKIKMKEDSIQKLIEEKSKTKDPAEASRIVKQMVVDHKEMQKAIASYEENRNRLKYRFPEAGLTKHREYERIEEKSLEDIETSWNLNTKIKSSVKNVKAKYGVKSESEGKKPHPTNSNPAAAVKESNPLADPMIISK